VLLVKNTPHAPVRLFVGVAPRKHVREKSNVHSETKIFNLETHEFGSNPPLKKNFGGRNIVGYFLAGTEVYKKNIRREMLRSFWRELEL
jgi:hypothetical protein